MKEEQQLNKAPTQFLWASFQLWTVQNQTQNLQASFLLFHLCKMHPAAAWFQHTKHNSGSGHNIGSFAALLTQNSLKIIEIWLKQFKLSFLILKEVSTRINDHKALFWNSPALSKTIWSSWWSFIKPGTIFANSIICWMTVVSFWAHSSHNSSCAWSKNDKMVGSFKKYEIK